MSKDFKDNGRGFGLELVGIRHSDRLARLLLCVRHWSTRGCCWERVCDFFRPATLVDEVRKPTLSCPKQGAGVRCSGKGSEQWS